MSPVKKQTVAISHTFSSKVGLLGLFFLLSHTALAVADTTAPIVQKQTPVQGKTPIAVIYPDIGEPYRSVFAQIVSGIEGKVKTPLAHFAMGPKADIEELKSNLRRQDVKVVIALGRQGMKLASKLDRNIGVVVGGVITTPENEMGDLPVNSLAPDPALLFSNLKALMPAVKRVFVVHDPRQNGWMIRLAKEAAHEQGLELVAYETQDLRNAARIYRDIFASVDSRRDALWLLQDSVAAEDGTILPLVLQESWDRNLAVFSSSLVHVRRGVLFSLYPDNVEMGRHLADSAQEYLASGEYGERGMILLREVLVAINLRTADHLGIKYGNKQSFGIVFPEQ
jgi:putative ABC transport system substrate-binding protein